MGILQTLCLAMGSAWVSGINLYATVLTLGILGRFGSVELPGNLQVLTNGWIIALAAVLYAIEFFADKIPYLDSVWDVIQAFVRIPAGAALAATAFSDSNAAVQIVALLLGGGLATGSQATKSMTRLAVNASPEPFSNVVASLVGDLTAFGMVLLGYFAPMVMLFALVIMVSLSIWLLPKVYRIAKGFVMRICGKRKSVDVNQRDGTIIHSDSLIAAARQTSRKEGIAEAVFEFVAQLLLAPFM